MGVNLTNYNACFKTLDPNYDVLKKHTNVIESSKETFENTKKFVEVLNKHSNNYSSLDHIASRISALNEYFCTSLGAKTNINLDQSRTVEEVKDAAKLCHSLAKMTLKDIPGFIESINKTLEEMKKELANQSQISFNSESMDAVDTQLLSTNNWIRMKGSDVVSLRPQQLMSTEKGFGVDSKVDPELSQIVKSLGKFAFMVQANEYKLGL